MKTAAEHQKKDLQDELHATIDAIIQAWPFIEHQAKTMGGGYPSDTLAGGSGNGDHVDGMLQRTIAMHQDLGQRSNHWLTELQVLVKLARRLQGRAANLLPLDDDEIEEARTRKNTVEKCDLCREPAPKVHRVDGKAYCANTCYYRVYRAGRQAASA